MKKTKPKSLLKLIMGDRVQILNCEQSIGQIEFHVKNGNKFVNVIEISEGLDEVTYHRKVCVNMDYVVYMKDID